MLPEATLNDIIEGVYSGKYSVFELPTVLYAYTVEQLDGMFFSGFGEVPRGKVKEIEKAVNYRQNIGRFSGAKTFQNTRDLTAFVFDEDGKKRPFAEFKARALEINKDYNIDWLRTEQDSVFIQSQNARKWLKYESEAEIFPYLRYVTVGDERVRHSHKNLDGLTAKINDPIWDRIMPQNGFGCRCIVTQHEATVKKSSQAQIRSKTRLIKEDFKQDTKKGRMDFDYNPGKTDFIFKEKGKGKHPYYKVPREFNDDLKKNFGLPTVGEVTGKLI